MRDLAGEKFVRLTAVRPAEERALCGRVRWICRCDCGNEATVDGGDLVRAKTISCGCARQGALTAKEQLARKKLYFSARPKRKAAAKSRRVVVDKRKVVCRDLTGKQYGLLKVRRFHHRDKFRKDHWLCVCRCERTRIVKGSALIGHRTQSCGSKGCKQNAA